MMKPKHVSAFSVLALALMGMSMVEPLAAQGGPPGFQKQAIEAMKQKQWSAAVETIDKCLETWGPRAKDLGFGDTFGWFYYQKGICLMQMKEFEKASQAFQDCYTKFPGEKNEFLRMSLYMKGQCEVGMKKYDDALKTLGKFLNERRDRGKEARINVGEVYSVMAQCYFLGSKPDFEKGIDAVTKCVLNRYKGQRIPDESLVVACVTMVRAALDQQKPQPVAKFFKDHPSVLNMGAYRMAPYGAQLVKLAADTTVMMGEAQEEGNDKLAQGYAQLAYQLYGFVPNISDVKGEIAEINKRVAPFKRFGGFRDTMSIYDLKQATEWGKIYQKFEKEQSILDAYALKGVANITQSYGSIRLSNAVYRLLEDRYSTLKDRETNLYQLAMTTWTLGDMAKASELVELHIKDFPKSAYAPLLNTMSLEKMLKEGKYEEVVVQARKVKDLNKNEPTGNFYILASYCEPAALVQLKRFKEAVPLLQDFIKKYPKSSYTQTVMFFLGSALTSLGRWEEAVKADSAYIQTYPSYTDNPYIANVLYERAFNNLQMKDKDKDQLALKDCESIIKELPDSKVYPLALLLKANILSTVSGKFKEANDCYVRSYEAAQKLDNKRCMSEAAYNLIANYAAEGSNRDPKKAREYYDLFWKECDSDKNPFACQTAVAGVSLYKNGKNKQAFEETRKKLAEIIVREGKLTPQNRRVEEAIGSYTKFYLDVHRAMGQELTPDQVREHFYNFPGVGDKDIELKTMLRIAVIGVYQKELEALKPEQGEAKAKLEGTISAFFRELREEYKPADLTSYTLKQLGDYLRVSAHPLEALPYYDEILKRNKDYVREAKLGKAIAMGNSGDNAKISEAIKVMNEELIAERAKKNPDRKAMEDGQRYLVLFQMNKKDYAKVAEEAKRYLDVKNYNKYRPEMLYNQGVAYAKMQKWNEAIAAFLNLNNNYKGNIKWSAPGMEELMKAFWQRNNPRKGFEVNSDRYLAWTQGESYIKVTKPIFQKMTVEERSKWRRVSELTERYGKDSSVMEEHRDLEARRAAIRESQGK